MSSLLSHIQSPADLRRLPFMVKSDLRDHYPFGLFARPVAGLARLHASSGTTGKPKCLVHRAGGVLVKHLVEAGLHGDFGPGDRVCFYTTTGWMMWNWAVSVLATGATLVLHDGAPTYPSSDALFGLADIADLTHLGLGARLLDAMLFQAPEAFAASRDRLSDLRAALHEHGLIEGLVLLDTDIVALLH